ncbi:hypothetical protein [Rossellomorea marisflavi]|uniref:hypothetical protein n=1 Tax=Rossellomorea marisflavi TaxID=189381 RepID=UPI003FA113C8
MKAYGLQKRDRIICSIKNCGCGDWSSKHPIVNKSDTKNKRLRKMARRESKQQVACSMKEWNGDGFRYE